MIDPLAEIVALLRPGAPFSKIASAPGLWRVQQRTERVFYSLILKGEARLSVDGAAPVTLTEGDFTLIPAACDVELTSPTPPAPEVESTPVVSSDGSVRFGDPDAPVEVQHLVGFCTFGSPDAALLLTLLPELLVVQGEDRLGILARLVADEARASRPARAVVLERLLEVLLIEALRSSPRVLAAPGLLRGLGDARLARPLRCIHADPARPWTAADLAREAGLSRSAFFARFGREVGVLPMDYLTRWRMTLAKDLLRQGGHAIADVAARVGYGSASAFSVAFARQEGVPPGRFAKV